MDLKINQKVIISSYLLGRILKIEDKSYIVRLMNSKEIKVNKSSVAPFKVKVHIREIANLLNCQINQVEII